MADELANFIESQKRKLEKERAELVRGANGEDQSRASPRGYNQDFRHSNRGPIAASDNKRKPPEENTNTGGLNLGGYEKVQQRLRQERQDEYRKFLSEKNFRSTGRVDVVNLTDGDRSPHPTKELQQVQPRSDKREDGDEVYYKESLRHRRRGKENYNDSPQDYDFSLKRGNRKPENSFESYEDLLERRRAQEKMYRRFDEQDLVMVRPMRLNTPHNRYNSRSDGYLNRRFDDDDDDDDDEWRSRRNQPRGQRERSFESKRVHFQGEENRPDDMWVKSRRRLNDYYDNDNGDDEEELLEWLRKRGRRPQRRNSSHEPERQTSKEESLQRSNTDSGIRSQSAPLEGAGVIGGHQESRSDKVKRQEQYKKDLQTQMQEQAEIKKREKMQRLGVQQDGTTSQNTQLDKTPPSVNRRSYPHHPENYGIPLANHGPSSRPPPHPTVYPNPYDDPYYYYGTLEMGAPQAPSMGAPLTAPMNVVPRVAVGPRADAQMSGGFTTPAPAAVLQQSGGDTSPRAGLQPPGGYSGLGALGSDQESAADKKKAAQQAYQEELKKQMQERSLKKQKEKEEKERYEMKLEQEIANYNPWGRGGGGAPLRDSGGQLVANLRTLKQYNDEGIKVSPRDLPPAGQTRFEVTQQATDLSPLQGLDGQGTAVQDLSGNVGRPSFGRSDPLKQPQPQDDQKKAARQEYQAYLRKQVEEKEKKKREELERQKEEEELLEKKILEDRIKLQKDFELEQEKSRRKEEEARLKNEEIRAAQEAKKMEAEKKRKVMEEQRQAELKRKLDEELAAKKASSVEAGQRRTQSDFRSSSPPIPTIAKQQNLQQRRVTPPETTTAASPTHPQPEPANSAVADQDVLSQLTALRQQLKNEEKRVQQQIDHTTAVTKYSNVQHAPEDLGSRRSRRDVDVFQRVLATKNAAGKSDPEGYSAAQEFNRIKNEETSSLAEEFRSKFPGPVATNSVLDLQQQAFLMEQEDKLAALRSDMNRQNKHLVKGEQAYLLSRRPVSRDSLLESESQFLAVDDPKDILPEDQPQSRPRQSSARERRRWKQLEEMARNPKAYDTYKPPTPGGFSLNSVTSFNVDEVAAKNEERLRRLEMIQQGRGGGQQGRRSIQGDPDQVLQRFIDEHRRPPLPSRLSDYPLEAETSFEPV